MKNEKGKQKSTSVLWERLFKAPSIGSYFDTNEAELGLPAFSELISALCRKKGEVPERIIKRAGIERSFGHQIFRGSRNPSRDTVLMLAFGFEADIDMTQELLRHSGHSQLYPRFKRDAAIGFCLEHKYTYMDTQHMLSEFELPILGGNTR